ncbi:hypothetical protein LJB77_01590 [Ruminococcaceae bacterium OttesenSCG-928-N02]|nr:hypothetical protein [Ruminococcaceae bacterium OttesenSCG-928-N02]
MIHNTMAADEKRRKTRAIVLTLMAEQNKAIKLIAKMKAKEKAPTPPWKGKASTAKIKEAGAG